MRRMTDRFRRLAAARVNVGPWVSLALLGWMACGPGEMRPTPANLEGAWRADLEHNGQRSSFGLEFRSIGWESFDVALSRGIFFRTLFRNLLEQLGGDECQRLAQLLGGYDLAQLGKLAWSA